MLARGRSLSIIVIMNDADLKSYGTMVHNAIINAGASEALRLHASAGHAFYTPVILKARSFIKDSEFDVLISLGSTDIIDIIDDSMTTYSERQRWVHIESIKEFVDNCGAYIANSYRAYIMMLPGLEMPSPPTFSIVTTLSQATPKIISAMWSSVLAQDTSYRNWEWIIVDDNSAEDAAHVRELVETTSNYDSRVVYTRLGYDRSGYSGLVKSRAFSVSSGLYVINLNQTDVLQGHLFDHLIQFLTAGEQSKKCGFVYTDTSSSTDNQVVYVAPDIESPRSFENIAFMAGHIWRRDVYNAVGGYNQKMMVAEDYELISRAFTLLPIGMSFTKLCISGFIKSPREPCIFEQYVVNMIREAYEPAIREKISHA